MFFGDFTAGLLSLQRRYLVLGGRDGGTIRLCPGISAFFTAFSSITFVYGRQKDFRISADGDRTFDTSASDLLSVSRRNLVSCSSSKCAFCLSLFILPVLLYQLPLSEWMEERKLSMYLLIETALLLFLLLVCDLNGGGNWFFPAALGVLLGLGLVFLPIILRQTLRDLPLYRHKSLLYLSVETVFFLLLLFIVALQGENLRGFWTLSLPNALLFLVLPWGVMGALRYLPVNRWLRAAAAFAWTGLWIWLAPAGFDQIMIPVYGQPEKPYSLAIPFDFTKWELPYNVWNVIMIILLALGAAALLCGVMGLRAMKSRRNP